MVVLYLLIAVLLLLLNAFFVLAEFAAVKMRPTRVEELVNAGDPRARIFQHVQGHLDEYLSVCQVGITFASIGLGFVGEPSIARLIHPFISWAGAASPALAHTVAVTIAYLIVSFLHILVGELVPKSVAIRADERSALLTARPLRFFRYVFYLPLVILNGSANFVLRLMGLPPRTREPAHSEQELKIILARSQRGGLISFRRLLFIENIFDLEGVKVRHAMKPRRDVKVLRVDAPWPENERVLRQTRYSRYPLVDERTSGTPLGIVHIKDLYYSGASPPPLQSLARPYLTVGADADLEQLLADMQRRRAHLAIVTGADTDWVGMITLEDVIEEIIGTIEDEFEVEQPWSLASALSAFRVVLGVEASSMEEAIHRIIGSVPAAQLPLPPETLVAALAARERTMSTYLGAGLALPHARLEGIRQPVVILGRSEKGVPVAAAERAHLFFVLLTSPSEPRSQVRLLARVASLMDSEFVREKLRNAGSQQEILEAVQQGEIATFG